MADALVQLVERFVEAHGHPTRPVPAQMLRTLDITDAMAVQSAVMLRLGETASVAKVAAPRGGHALASPIPGRWVKESGDTLDMKGRNILGAEIEVAAVLKNDVTPELARQGSKAVLAAIDHFVVGIELIGTRIDNHGEAGAFGPLSDFMITAGFIRGRQKIPDLPQVNGLQMCIQTPDGTEFLGVSKHPFGGILEPLIAYASSPIDHFGGLRGGMTVTTGSLCSLIEIPSDGHLQVQLGSFDKVSVHLPRSYLASPVRS